MAAILEGSVNQKTIRPYILQNIFQVRVFLFGSYMLSLSSSNSVFLSLCQPFRGLSQSITVCFSTPSSNCVIIAKRQSIPTQYYFLNQLSFDFISFKYSIFHTTVDF